MSTLLIPSLRSRLLMAMILLFLVSAAACSSDETGSDSANRGAGDDHDAWGFEEDTTELPPDAGQPDNGSEQPDNSSEQPDNSSEQPDNSSEQPDNSSEQPDNSSEQPDNSSEQPDDLYQSTGDPYDVGPLTVQQLTANDAPAPLLIFAPSEDGIYPVVIFQHGFLMANSHYSELLTHLASHGFVVVAPQMYEAGGLPIGTPSSQEESQLASQVYAWLEDNLDDVVTVEARVDRLGMAGHSRGAKVIWLSLRDAPRPIQALAGVDPVDGTGGPLGGEARMLDNPPTIAAPELIIGSGLGPIEQGFFQPACAPAGDNYQDFFAAATAPAWEVVATDYGHLDMLDDNPACGFECDACEDGPSRAPMRTLTAGQLAAFYRAYLQDDSDVLSFVGDATTAPIAIETRSK